MTQHNHSHTHQSSSGGDFKAPGSPEAHGRDTAYIPDISEGSVPRFSPNPGESGLSIKGQEEGVGSPSFSKTSGGGYALYDCSCSCHKYFGQDNPHCQRCKNSN